MVPDYKQQPTGIQINPALFTRRFPKNIPLQQSRFDTPKYRLFIQYIWHAAILMRVFLEMARKVCATIQKVLKITLSHQWVSKTPSEITGKGGQNNAHARISGTKD